MPFVNVGNDIIAAFQAGRRDRLEREELELRKKAQQDTSQIAKNKAGADSRKQFNDVSALLLKGIADGSIDPQMDLGTALEDQPVPGAIGVTQQPRPVQFQTEQGEISVNPVTQEILNKRKLDFEQGKSDITKGRQLEIAGVNNAARSDVATQNNVARADVAKQNQSAADARLKLSFEKQREQKAIDEANIQKRQAFAQAAADRRSKDARETQKQIAQMRIGAAQINKNVKDIKELKKEMDQNDSFKAVLSTVQNGDASDKILESIPVKQRLAFQAMIRENNAKLFTEKELTRFQAASNLQRFIHEYEEIANEIGDGLELSPLDYFGTLKSRSENLMRELEPTLRGLGYTGVVTDGEQKMTFPTLSPDMVGLNVKKKNAEKMSGVKNALHGTMQQLMSDDLSPRFRMTMKQRYGINPEMGEKKNAGTKNR